MASESSVAMWPEWSGYASHSETRPRFLVARIEGALCGSGRFGEERRDHPHCGSEADAFPGCPGVEGPAGQDRSASAFVGPKGKCR